MLKKDGPIVTYGDDSKGKTKRFRIIRCKNMEFKNDSYVMGLEYNLISINQLCDVDYEDHFNKNEGNTIDSKKSISLTTNRKNNI